MLELHRTESNRIPWGAAWRKRVETAESEARDAYSTPPQNSTNSLRAQGLAQLLTLERAIFRHVYVSTPDLFTYGGPAFTEDNIADIEQSQGERLNRNRRAAFGNLASITREMAQAKINFVEGDIARAMSALVWAWSEYAHTLALIQDATRSDRDQIAPAIERKTSSRKALNSRNERPMADRERAVTWLLAQPKDMSLNAAAKELHADECLLLEKVTGSSRRYAFTTIRGWFQNVTR